MEDPEVTSYDFEKEGISLRKNFSTYVTKIELELQQFGFQVPQSEILGYIMEKLTGIFFQRSKLTEEENVPIDASEEEIVRYIINRKYPYMFKFDKENSKLNKLQRFIRDSRINNLSDRSAIWILRGSQSINFVFLLFALLLGTQSLFSLITIFASPDAAATSFKLLDGDLIFGYSMFWRQEILLAFGFFFVFDLVQTYLVLNIPTLGRIIPKLNDNYSRTILRTNINFVMFFSYVTYIFLGLVVIEPRTGLSMNGMLEISAARTYYLVTLYIVSILSFIFGGLIIFQIRREKISSLNYKRIRMRNRLVFYFINFLTLILSLALLSYLSLLIRSDAEKALNTTINTSSIDYDLTVLNFLTIIFMSFYFIVFIISSLINHSHDKNNWIKFLNIQILLQATLILVYSISQIWIITRFNSFMEFWDNDLRIQISDLWQGMIRYAISILVSIGFLRLSK